jgi:hypothetical protein
VLEGTVFHDSIRSALGKIRAALSPELREYLLRLASLSGAARRTRTTRVPGRSRPSATPWWRAR